jgi:hypothetical protein
VKKLVALAAGAIAAGSAALISAGVATSEPSNANGLNVVGEPYNQALQILKSQGVKAYFGGSHGSDVSQSACIVDQQKITSGGRMYLVLDCTQEAVEEAGELQTPGGPSVGSNGVTTVTPTPVVPIQGAPGAGAPPPA